MPDVTFIAHDGSTHILDAAPGLTLMQVATGTGIDGIVAECGGQGSCATCHVVVDDAWIARLPVPLAPENDRLDFLPGERLPGSRLACQVVVDDELHGLVVHLPESQYW